MTAVVSVPTPRNVPPVPLGWLEPVVLYRHTDAAGHLLYVGITSDPARRWEQHAETSLWARCTATTYLQWFPDRATARAAEKRAIRFEDPIFNSARPGNGRAVTERKLAYLDTGADDEPRRVPCQSVAGEFCIACGPDAEAWLEALPC